MQKRLSGRTVKKLAIILTVVLYLSLVLIPNIVKKVVAEEPPTATLIGEIWGSYSDTSGRTIWYVKPFNHELGDILIPFFKTRESKIYDNGELSDHIGLSDPIEIVYNTELPDSTTQFYGYEVISLKHFEGDVDSVVNDISFVIRDEKIFRNRFFLEKFNVEVLHVVKLEDRAYGYLVYGKPYNEYFEGFTLRRKLTYDTICFYVDKETEIDEISRLLIEEGRIGFEINIKAPKINAYEQMSVPVALSMEFDNWGNCKSYTREEFDNYSVLTFYKFGGISSFSLNKTDTEPSPIFYYYDLASGKISMEYTTYSQNQKIDDGDLFLLNVKNGNRLSGRSINEVSGNDVEISLHGQGVTGVIVISAVPIEETDYNINP